MTGPRLVVIGDLMLDRFWWGAATRRAPASGAPVLAVEGRRASPGGAGNVAVNVVGLGGACVAVGVLGDDPEGAALRAALAERGVALRAVVDGRPTTCKTRLVEGARVLLRVDREETSPVAGAAAGALEAGWKAALDGAAAVVLSDYGKGVCTADRCRAVLAAAGGRPAVVDPKRVEWAALAGATALTPNLDELRAAVGWAVADEAGPIVEAARAARRRLGVGALVVTRAAAGAVVVADGAARVFEAAGAAVDPDGAGDTVTACVALELARGATLWDAAARAMHAAAAVVGRPGVRAATAAEVDARVAAGAAR